MKSKTGFLTALTFSLGYLVGCSNPPIKPTHTLPNPNLMPLSRMSSESIEELIVDGTNHVDIKRSNLRRHTDYSNPEWDTLADSAYVTLNYSNYLHQRSTKSKSTTAKANDRLLANDAYHQVKAIPFNIFGQQLVEGQEITVTHYDRNGQLMNCVITLGDGREKMKGDDGPYMEPGHITVHLTGRNPSATIGYDPSKNLSLGEVVARAEKTLLK